MKKLALTSLFGLVALVGLAAAYPLASASGSKNTRSDCPGKVTCPLTGEEVCKDRCPLAAKKTDAAKLTDTKETLASEEAELPACCRNKK